MKQSWAGPACFSTHMPPGAGKWWLSLGNVRILHCSPGGASWRAVEKPWAPFAPPNLEPPALRCRIELRLLCGMMWLKVPSGRSGEVGWSSLVHVKTLAEVGVWS